MSRAITSIPVNSIQDVSTARLRAKQLAALMGFAKQDCVRVATAISEIARNCLSYGGGGAVELGLSDDQRSLTALVSDRGPGIPRLPEVLAGTYRSETGMGMGILGAKRLMDRFSIRSTPGQGTVVSLEKQLPLHAPTPDWSTLAVEMAGPSNDQLEEMQQQNRELLEALNELSRKQDELQQLNRELEETNRGVLALSAELEEKAEHLRQAGELKSRFLSHASHEFRTPLNGIIGLTNLLLSKAASRSEEENRQIVFIQRSAMELTDLVNDLLDLAKVEAGKLALHPSQFEAYDLLSALRGMFRALQTNEAVSLIFEDPEPMPPMLTDESKVAQIVRNFISNALKFTEKGEVRVTAQYKPESDSVVFRVSDTGIGIAPQNQERIFQEFAQIDSPVQRRVKGTGLGLPLCRQLAQLLGGGVEVQSELGRGATFSASIRRRLPGWDAAGAPAKVLLIDDEEISRYLIRNLIDTTHEVYEAANGKDGLELAQSVRPDLILLDLDMPGMNGFETLEHLRRDEAMAKTSVAIVTAKHLSASERESLNDKTIAILSKGVLARASALLIDPGPPAALMVKETEEPENKAR